MPAREADGAARGVVNGDRFGDTAVIQANAGLGRRPIRRADRGAGRIIAAWRHVLKNGIGADAGRLKVGRTLGVCWQRRRPAPAAAVPRALR